MKSKVNNYIINNNLLNKNQYIITAVSGGMDSICLLHILYSLGYKVVLAHVNHHKRIESDIEQKEMELLAKKLNIPFELFNYYDNNQANFHDQAHDARYDFFKKVADNYIEKDLQVYNSELRKI